MDESKIGEGGSATICWDRDGDTNLIWNGIEQEKMGIEIRVRGIGGVGRGVFILLGKKARRYAKTMAMLCHSAHGIMVVKREIQEQKKCEGSISLCSSNAGRRKTCLIEDNNGTNPFQTPPNILLRCSKDNKTGSFRRCTLYDTEGFPIDAISSQYPIAPNTITISRSSSFLGPFCT
jgi:hypothetical protein